MTLIEAAQSYCAQTEWSWDGYTLAGQVSEDVSFELSKSGIERFQGSLTISFDWPGEDDMADCMRALDAAAAAFEKAMQQ